MNWLTREEIVAEAKKGLLPALKCSLKHWEQINSVSREELQAALFEQKVGLTGSHCALCEWHNCQSFRTMCPLTIPIKNSISTIGCNGYCCDEYRMARMFANKNNVEPHTYCGPMIERLKKEIEKHEKADGESRLLESMAPDTATDRH